MGRLLEAVEVAQQVAPSDKSGRGQLIKTPSDRSHRLPATLPPWRMPMAPRGCDTAGPPTGAAWRRGGVMDAVGELLDLQGAYRSWSYSLPANVADSAAR